MEITKIGNVLTDLFIVPDYDKAEVGITFTAPAGFTACKWEIVEKGSTLVKGVVSVKTKKVVQFKAHIPDFKPWHVHSPYLYTLKLLLTIEGRVVVLDRAFGMRKIHVSSGQIFVNNEPFYVRGYIRGRKGHEHPNFENLPLDKYYEKS